MNKEIIIDKLRTIFINVLEHEDFEINDELSAGDVSGWDSLSHMLIIGEVEEMFSIKFKFKELNKMKNLGDMITLIGNKLNL